MKLVSIVSQLANGHMVLFKDKLKIDTTLFPEVNAYSLIAMTYQFLLVLAETMRVHERRQSQSTAIIDVAEESL
ncbi:hypothetical protein BELL_0244g00090 [Botrytis elliptica]|uniref:Uncharacterized protein n=1 Tax=Botrytis elliptica TaxID=278938 RepID=A0A4Z1JNQ8_9HELO|nr:hypothetical protein BELL_0244g00090 [Botrytis elliptica]